MVPTRTLPGLCRSIISPIPRINVVPSSEAANAFSGRWIDAARHWTDIAADIDRLLIGPGDPSSKRTQWMIADWEGFGSWTPDGNESLEMIAAIALGIMECGPAFSHWVSHASLASGNLIDRFYDDFLGEWADVEEFASQVIADATDNLAFIPDWLAPYIQIDLVELAQYLTDDLLVVEDDATVFVYSR